MGCTRVLYYWSDGEGNGDCTAGIDQMNCVSSDKIALADQVEVLGEERKTTSIDDG